MKKLGLFEGFGVELEYMIVDKDSLRVLPITDKILQKIAGTITDEVENGKISWSNELVLHVIELKTTKPTYELANLDNLFLENIHQINKIASEWNGILMPTAMHPLMNPDQEMKLWPHGYKDIYSKYDEIFSCKGHGWSNLQSIHLNLPFKDDEEFAQLHTAIRLLLPLLPALAASSPIKEGKLTGYHDTRLEVYRFNQKRIPEIAGEIIPEIVFSQKEYEEKILEKTYEAIKPFDPNGILQDEWLNSRGAIARFQRNAIEIRVLDIQECALADIAIVYAIVSTLKSIIQSKWASFDKLKNIDTTSLANVLLQVIQTGEETIISYEPLLQGIGFTQPTSAKNIWKKIVKESTDIPEQYKKTLNTILEQGSLSTRIQQAIKTPDHSTIEKVYRTLCNCLETNTLFQI